MAARWVRIVLADAARERGYFALRVANRERFAPAAGPLPMLARLSQDPLEGFPFDTRRGPTPSPLMGEGWGGGETPEVARIPPTLTLPHKGGGNRKGASNRSEPALALDIDPAEGRLEPITGLDLVVAKVRLALGTWQGARLDFGGVELYPDGSRAATRRFRKHVEASRRHDSAWDGELLAAHPEIVRGWPEASPPPSAPREPKIAVALHLYYPELWGEIETLLGRWRQPFRLFLTLNAADSSLEARVLAAFPDAHVRVVENRGRDIRPFLLWLEEGAFDGFLAVCKIHGKRSFGGGRLPAFGDALRRVNFFDLIADPDRVGQIVARFAADPRLGLVGSRHFFIVSSAASPKDVLGANRLQVAALAARLAAPLNEPEFDFFEGTMFWVRPESLAPLRALRLSRDAFDAEAGRVDGALEHALERLFNHVARSAGYAVETTP